METGSYVPLNFYFYESTGISIPFKAASVSITDAIRDKTGIVANHNALGTYMNRVPSGSLVLDGILAYLTTVHKDEAETHPNLVAALSGIGYVGWVMGSYGYMTPGPSSI